MRIFRRLHGAAGRQRNGETAFQFTDLFQVNGKLTHSAVGLRLASNVGGFQVLHTDVVFNGANVIIDQSQIALGNSQLFFGEGFNSDATNPAAYPSASQIGVEFAEPGSLEALAIFASGSTLFSATRQCLVVDPVALHWKIHIYGEISNCHTPTASNGAIENDSTSSDVIIDISATTMSETGGMPAYGTYSAGVQGPDVYSVGGATPASIQGVRFQSNTAGHIGGSWSGSYVDEFNSVISSAAGNMTLAPTPGKTLILGTLPSTNCGLWVQATAIIPNFVSGVGGICNFQIGTSSFPFSDIEASLAHFYGLTQLIDPTASATYSLLLSATSDANGVGFKMIGNGSAKPSKVMRVIGGVWQLVNDAYSVVLLSIDDLGNAVFASSVKSPTFEFAGSTPVSSGSCAINAQAGGNSGGTFKFNGACGSGTVTFTFATSAPIGWHCTANNLITPGHTIQETGYSATTATFTVTGAASTEQATIGCFAF